MLPKCKQGDEPFLWLTMFVTKSSVITIFLYVYRKDILMVNGLKSCKTNIHGEVIFSCKQISRRVGI